MKRICIYCGSSSGSAPEYLDAATAMGKVIAENNLELVYGGARVGLMGAVADSVLRCGGHVIGVIPEFLNDKVSHEGLSELHVTGSMHDRKNLMFELSDAFIAMPGGLGTLEELFEVVTWAQLGSHGKPCGLLNINNYYGKLIEFLNHSATQGFIHPKHLDIITSDSDPESLLEKFSNYTSPAENNTDKLSLFASRN